ncbi:MAG: hypothetical protein K6F58_00200, partial [Bacteroidales bacterium]|nr:hypothetical protein [Bacteroidales bacterium]
ADLVQFASDYNSGYYASVLDSLTVTLDSDITFDAESSAEFNATGGIGTKDGDNTNYFHGVFNGGMHAIKGLSATVPVFAYVGSEGTVKKLVVDATSSFVFTHSGAADSNFGAVAGYHKGVLDTVSVSADVTLAAAENVAFETCLGGIVGRETVGSVKNSAYSGKIKVKPDFSSADAKIMIGGIVGRISNADGKVQDSAFSGLIDNEGKMIASSETDALKSNPYLMIGGIAGLNSGTIDKCTVANHDKGITVTMTDDEMHDYTGTVVTHSTNAYHYAIAGIAGRNDGTVSACTNNATVLNAFYGERGTSGNMNGRYLNVGGLVGFNGSDATVSGSTNNGPIIDRAIPKMHYVAGIVGRNKGKVSSCTNTSDGSISVGTAHITPYGARMLYLGGVAGYSEKGSAVDDISNAGEITVSRYENTTGIIVAIGGVVGKSDVDVDGSTGTIANSGAITQSNGCGLCAEPTSDNDYGLFLGGVVGYATASVKKVSNSGALSYTCSASGKGARYVHLGGVAGKVNAASTVDIEHCTNTANVTYVAKAKYGENNATRYYHNYVGGIVGYANNAAIKGDSSSKCTNTGIVKAGDASANNNNNGDDVVPSFVVGGIVGHITGASSIEYCELAGTGQSYNDHFSNRVIDKYDCPSNGGIAGQVVGADGTPISISHCAVSSTASTAGTAGNTAVYSRRGATGGIVGIAEYATVSDCSVPVDYTGSGYYYGGIAGLIKNGTISSCNYTGTKIQSTQIKLGGGIVGKLDAAGIVDACTSSATTIDKNGTAITDFGGIAGVSVAGSTIKNSHCKSGMAICSDANFTDGGGNAADL